MLHYGYFFIAKNFSYNVVNNSLGLKSWISLFLISYLFKTLNTLPHMLDIMDDDLFYIYLRSLVNELG